MTDDLLRHLDDTGIAGIDTAWSGELRIHDDTYHDARLLPCCTANDLEAAGLVTCHGTANKAPPRLREHMICVLTEKGKRTRAERAAAYADPDELTVATALGQGSPLLSMLKQIRELLSGCHAELIAVRCSMMAAAHVSGEGDRFANMLEKMMRLDAEAREVTKT